MDTAETHEGFDFELFKDNLLRMINAGEDVESSDCFRDIALEMLKKLDTEELEGLSHEILRRRAMNCGNEDESVREAMTAAEGFRRRAVVVRARKVLVEEEGVDWSKVGMITHLDYMPAETGRADIDGCPYVEIYADLGQLDDPKAFVAMFEDREPKNIRVTGVVDNKVNIYVPLDYVMHKEGLSEDKPQESPVDASVEGEVAGQVAAAVGQALPGDDRRYWRP